jgi:Domain of unknown function (DUF3854)
MTGPRFPNYLTESHLAQLHASGLTDETIALAGVRSEGDSKTIRKLLNLPQEKHDFGWSLIFPCMLPGSAEPHAHRVRPDVPRVTERNGKKHEHKYESPAGKGIVVYIPPRTLAEGRLQSDAPIIIVEGEKKALILDQLGYAVIGITGVTNWHDAAARNPKGEPENSGPLLFHPMIRKHVKFEGRDVIIAFDSDATDPKKSILHEVKKIGRVSYEAGAASVRLAMPPDAVGCSKTGIDDFYTFIETSDNVPTTGAKAVAEVFAAATLWERHRCFRPDIVLGEDEHRVTNEASEAIAVAPDVYKRDGMLVRAVLSEQAEITGNVHRVAGFPQIRRLAAPTLSETLTLVADIVKTTDAGDKPAHPPRWLIDQLSARGDWPKVRPLDALIDSPMLRPDGSILSENGYDPCLRVLVQLDPALQALEVPTDPTQDDARAAAHQLLRPFSDFPFAAESDRAAMLACVLSGFARLAYAGPTPGFLFDAPTKGTGKTKAAKAAGLIITGRDPGESGYAHDTVEMAKRITSIALQGDRIVVLDNIVGSFGNEALNRALTSTLWKERLLSKNEAPALALLCLWLFTGNNVDVRDDMTRRLIMIRLLSLVERPEERSGFAFPDLESHIRANRATYVVAALTILRAFVVAGRPTTGLSRLGSFEGWRDLVAGAVLFGYGVDPMQSRHESNSAAHDDELHALRSLVAAMRMHSTPKSGMRAREMLIAMGLDETGAQRFEKVAGSYGRPDQLRRAEPTSEAWRDVRDQLDVIVRRKDREPPPTAQRLGRALKRSALRVVQDVLPDGSSKLVRLTQTDERHTQVWWIERVDQQWTGDVRGDGGGCGGDPAPFTNSNPDPSDTISHARDRQNTRHNPHKPHTSGPPEDEEASEHFPNSAAAQ